MKVNFVIGGTQKGGTSALDSFLRQHPQICLPNDLKEVHFFDREEVFRAGKPDYDKYHAHFRPGPQHLTIGEASPIYMYWKTAPARIQAYNPQMRWVLILRNPVDRAYSAWNMERNRGADNLSFEEAVSHEPERCREAFPLQHRVYSYLDRGFYTEQVRRLFDMFGRENCLVLLNEDLQSNHDKTLRDVFSFLGVNDSLKVPQSRVFEHGYEQLLDPILRTKLLERFSSDIRELERLIDRDLSGWTTNKEQTS